MPETTTPGHINDNQQQVVRATDLPGTDFSQKVYVLRCRKCSCEYGANGSDIHERKCPSCQGGRPGLPTDNRALQESSSPLNTESLRTLQANFEHVRLEKQAEDKELKATWASFIRKFPASAIAALDLKSYAIGTGSEDTFCYWVEIRTRPLGSIHGATALKFRIYYDKEKGEYVYLTRYRSAEEAFDDTKALMSGLLKAVDSNDLESIDNNPLSPMFKSKLLSLYYPDRFVPIFSDSHLDHFLRHLHLPSLGLSHIEKILSLGRVKKADSLMARWSPYEFMHFLYDAFGRPTDDAAKETVATELQDHIDSKKEFPTDRELEPHVVTGTITRPKEKRSFDSTDHTTALGQRITQEELGQRGLQGELVVLKFERERLSKAGKGEFARQIEHTALRNPAAGYDISSFNDDGTPRRIEVKATASGPSTQTSFFLTRNELETGKRCLDRGERFYLYRVYSVKSKTPEVLCVSLEELLKAASFEPLVFEVSFGITNEKK